MWDAWRPLESTIMTKKTNKMLHKIITMVLPMSNGKRKMKKTKVQKCISLWTKNNNLWYLNQCWNPIFVEKEVCGGFVAFQLNKVLTLLLPSTRIALTITHCNYAPSNVTCGEVIVQAQSGIIPCNHWLLILY